MGSMNVNGSPNYGLLLELGVMRLGRLPVGRNGHHTRLLSLYRAVVTCPLAVCGCFEIRDRR